MDTSPIAPPSPGKARTSSRARVRYNSSMKLLRRAHMYAGLFLVPFILLYGVTAFLFNHPDWLSDRSVRLIGSEEVTGTALADFPSARALASQVVEAINQGGPPEVTLSRTQAPAYSRDLALTATAQGVERVIFVELEGRVGTVRTAPASAPISPPAWVKRSVALAPTPAESARTAVAAILEKWQGRGDQVKVRTAPELLFAVEDHGTTRRVAYNLQTGAMILRDAEPVLPFRRFLTSLHLACRYPTGLDIRWVWAFMVDAMALAMVFWGVSGLLMWWQMKSLRRLGTLTLAISLIASLWVAIGMHGVINR